MRQRDTSASGRMEPSGSLPGDGASRPAGGALRSLSGIREGCGHWGRGQWENFLKLFFRSRPVLHHHGLINSELQFCLLLVVALLVVSLLHMDYYFYINRNDILIILLYNTNEFFLCVLTLAHAETLKPFCTVSYWWFCSLLNKCYCKLKLDTDRTFFLLRRCCR